MMIEIWVEGYGATGESGTAYKMWEGEAEDFDSAVERMLKEKESIASLDGGWPKIRKYYDKRKNRLGEEGHYIWSCKLYNNETDARRSFG